MFRNNLLFGALISFFCFISCKNDIKQPPYPIISTDVHEMEFAYEGGEKELNLVINRDWVIETKADWLAFDYEDTDINTFGENTVKICVTALYNNVGNKRKANVRFRTNPATAYTDLTVTQDKNPQEEPELLYFNGFGEGAAEGTDGWPLLDKASFMNVAEGEYASVVKYYNPHGKMSYRYSGSSESDEYPDATGKNHLFFGTISDADDVVDFAIGDIPVHNKATALKINFAYTHGNFKTISDEDLMDGMSLYLSRDGVNWIKVEYSGVRYETPKYLYCTYEFHFNAGSFDKLFCLFAASTASTYRLDDIKISKADESAGTAIDWENATETINLGEPLVIPE